MLKDKKIRNKESEELKIKCDEYLNGWKRAQADYQNLKKQSEEDRTRWVKMANADLIMELLPVYDNLKLALEHVPEDQKSMGWVVGIEHIKNQLTNFFNNQGVEEIVAKTGDRFDLETMEAVESINVESINKEQLTTNKDDTEEQPGPDLKIEDKEQLVEKMIKAGYRMKGKVVVPVRVVVK